MTAETLMKSSEWADARGGKWLAQLAGMEAMLAPVDEPLIRALRLEVDGRGYRIADIGCGGGGTSFEILRQAPAGSVVVHGFDISPGLIEAARTRGGSPAPVFACADVATAAPPSSDGLYDRLASRFGVMFFEDPAAAFRNLATRWLAPGGRFAFAVWGRLDANPWMTVVRDVVAEFVALPLVSEQSDAPGPFRYAEVEKLLGVLERAGFEGLDVREWRGTLPIGGCELPAHEAAEFAIASFSSFGELLDAAGAGVRDAAQDRLTERFLRHQRNNGETGVRLDACVHIVSGGAHHG